MLRQVCCRFLNTSVYKCMLDRADTMGVPEKAESTSQLLFIEKDKWG
jgi:hypothetical protein